MAKTVTACCNKAKSLLHKIGRSIVSVSLFVKILGMGVLIALIFGSLMIYHTRHTMYPRLYGLLEERAAFNASLLATAVEQPMATGDFFAVHLQLQRGMEMFSHLRYGIVENREGRIVAHTFPGYLPPSLLLTEPGQGINEKQVVILGSPEGNIVEVTVPLVKGYAGRLRLGILDKMVEEELSLITGVLLWAMLFCSALVIVLALLLTYILTHPIHNLVKATEELRQGKFHHRARVFWGDEIGSLAAAFNQLARSLEDYQSQVARKEAERLHLLERIVFLQEEERRRISRDLHDQIGQALLVLLLTIQSLKSTGKCSQDAAGQLDGDIRSILEEVRELAWDMHPAILEDYGLHHAIRRYLSSLQRPGLAVDYQYLCSPELAELPIQTRINLYRIVQEALSNIIRHAKAGRVSIVLMRSREETILLVEDDGVGFDPAILNGDAQIHLGLIGMRERAGLMGGEFVVESKPGGGTTIRVKIPADLPLLPRRV